MFHTDNFLRLNVDMLPEDVIQLFSKKNYACYGFAVVVDKSDSFLGILSVSDFLSFSIQFSMGNKSFLEFINRSPDLLLIDDIGDKNVNEVIHNLVPDPRLLLHQYTPIVTAENKVFGIYNRSLALTHVNADRTSVCIVGMGFVGLTLSIGLATKGLTVYGYDKNSDLLDSIADGEITVKEPDIQNKINNVIQSENLKLVKSIDQLPKHINTFIICVGTPVDCQGKADLRAIYSSLKDVALTANPGTLVLLRSTVPVGTTRAIANFIESCNANLIPGENLFVSFSPERTVEGNAIHETFSIPQIVGGFSRMCELVSSNFWKQVNQNIVITQTLEEAELVKLVNNSFRDLSFAFANSLIDLCEPLNISVSSLINSANSGYPRNKISLPSPGVGGYCLTKDPLLLADSWTNHTSYSDHPGISLPRLSRQVNDRAATYPFRQFNKYLDDFDLDPQRLNVLICGIAFKGIPETNDLRGSCGIDLYNQLTTRCDNIYLYDKIADTSSITTLSFTPDNDLTYDAVFLMNNHPSNYSLLFSLLTDQISIGFVFDGWEGSRLTSAHLRKINYFSTLGQTQINYS